MMPIDIINNLILGINETKVSYCHFKSNEHLEAALQGDTDLDILFDGSRKLEVERVVFNSGFIRMKAVGLRKYPDIEDYIGIDDRTGKVVHIHAHFVLLGGESGVKPFHIRLEDLLLSNRVVYSADFPIYIASPESEILLLIVRASLKLSLRQKVRSFFGDRVIGGDTLREMLWLKNRYSRDLFLKIIPVELNSIHNIGILLDMINNGVTYRKLKIFYKINFNLFQRWRLIGGFRSAIKRINYFIVRVKRKTNINTLTPFFRTFEGEGLIVATLGVDGAGKSTQNNLIPRELRKKVDVLYLYMGSGDGHSSWYRYPLKLLMDMRSRSKKSRLSSYDDGVKSANSANPGFLLKLLKLIWAVSLAFERQRKIEVATIWKRRGGVVICDRYPQFSVKGYNDGPLLNDFINSNNFILKRISKWESDIYERANCYSPDLVLLLWASVDEIHKRRPEMSRALIEKKQLDLLDSVKFPDRTKVVRIESVGGEVQVFSKCMSSIHEMFIRNFEKNSYGH